MEENNKNWSAKITNTEFKNGMLSVTVDFIKGEQCVSEVFQTSQGQTDSWLAESIARKIASLSAVEELHGKIEVGEVSLEKVEAASARDIFAKDLATMQKMVNAMQQGIIERDNPAFVELKAKLKANFLPEYADLF